MKNTLIYLLSSFLFLACNSKNDNYNTIVWLQTDMDSINNKADTVEIEYLNKKGNLEKKEIRYSALGEEIQKIYFYNSKGEQVSYMTKYGNLHTYKTDAELDSFGSIKELKSYEIGIAGDTSIDVYVNEYNVDSTVILSRIFTKGEDSSKLLYKDLYDNQRHLIKRVILKHEKDKYIDESVETYEFDRKGNKISAVTQNFMDSVTTKTISIYGEKNNLLKESYSKNNELLYDIEYKYENGRKKEAIKNIPGKKKRYKILFIYI